MQQSDERAFGQFWNLLRSGYDRPELSRLAIRLEFEALSEYDLDTLMEAAGRHKKDPKEGKYPPTPAHLIAQIQGVQPDPGRVMPDAYAEFNPRDLHQLPAFPLTPDEIQRNAEREADAKAKAAEERRKVRDMLKTKGLIKAMPGAGSERRPLPPLNGPSVRTGANGTQEFLCSDGRWI